MESSCSETSYEDRESDRYSDSESSTEELRQSTRFYVTRESQEDLSEPSKKLSYVGMRNLSELDKIQEQDIMAPDGSVMGVKNRVRAGLAHFENPEAIRKASLNVGGWGCYIWQESEWV